VPYRGFQRSLSPNTLRIGHRVRQREAKRIGDDPIFHDFVYKRFIPEILELKKPSTQHGWQICYKEMIDDFGYMKMSKITRQTLQLYFTKISKRLSPSTVHGHWTALNAVLKYAQSEGLIGDYIRPVLPKRIRPKQDWLTMEDMKKLIATATGKFRVFLMLLVETGCRIGEALGLQTRDLDVENKTIRIDRTIFHHKPNSPKTESSKRTIAISDELCYALDSLRVKAEPELYIFRTRFKGPLMAGVQGVKLQAVCDKANVKRVGFHALRRGNITHLILQMEIPESIVGQRVGHLSGGMTLGVYVQHIEGIDKKWVSKIAEAVYGSEETE
jgi:integrase